MPDSTLRQIDPPQHPRPEEARRGLRMDLTVNIPTMIMLLTMVSGVIGFGVTKYAELEKVDLKVAGDIHTLRSDLDKLSSSHGGIVREMREGLDALRKENREDFRETRGLIRDALERPTPDNAKGWTK